MRVSRIVWIGVGLILLLALASCGYSATRPDLLLNPISRQIYLSNLRPDPHPGSSWYTEPVDLVPQNFTIGEPIDAAQERLTDAGYRLWELPFEVGSAPSIQTVIHYFLEGQSFFLFCEDYLVELHASADRRLLTSTATKRHNRCVM